MKTNHIFFPPFLIPDWNPALLSDEAVNDTRKGSQIAAWKLAGAGGDAATVSTSRAIVEDKTELPGVELNCCRRFGTMFCFISPA